VKRRQYSESLKSRVIAAHRDGSTPAELAEKYGINVKIVYAWTGKAKKAGTTASKKSATTKSPDADRIVTELLASLRPGLVEAIGNLIDLGVERKLASARTSILVALKGAA